MATYCIADTCRCSEEIWQGFMQKASSNVDTEKYKCSKVEYSTFMRTLRTSRW